MCSGTRIGDGPTARLSYENSLTDYSSVQSTEDKKNNSEIHCHIAQVNALY